METPSQSAAPSALRADSPMSPEAVTSTLKHVQETIIRLQRRQYFQEVRINDLEHQLESYAANAAQFPLFSKLPPELRRKIWALALPSQIFRPFRHLQPSFLERKSLPPPLISGVNREARQVAYENGTFYCHEVFSPLCWAWFDGSRDTLDLSPYYMSENGYIPLQTKLLRETQTLMLDVNLIDDTMITGVFGKDSHLTSVHTVFVMAGNAYRIDKQSWHPHAVARLFDNQAFAHVDIEDPQAVERLLGIIELAGQANGCSMSQWHVEDIARLREQIQPPEDVVTKWNDAKRRLMEGWIKHHRGEDEELPRDLFDDDGTFKEDDDGNFDQDKIRNAYPDMPAIKLVQTFELEPIPRLAKWLQIKGRSWVEDARG